MAEGKKEKKKGGKLPIILVAALVVVGGGFFAMSGGKKEEPEEKPIEVGGVESLGEEMVINLKDGRTFLVCQISVQTEKETHASDPTGGAEGHGGGTYSVARDAVNLVLSQKTIDDLTKPDALKFLKRELAAAINHNLHAAHPPEEEEKDKKSESKKDKKKGKEEEEEEADHGHVEIDHEYLDEIGMDAEEGPILRVYFDKFMYQKN